MKVAIFVSGGIVKEVYVDSMDIQVALVDRDNIKDGDNPPRGYHYLTRLAGSPLHEALEDL